MTPQEAAELLGIPAEQHEAFETLVDQLREPETEREELARLRAELERVNDELRKSGIDSPAGARGVAELRRVLARALHLRQSQFREAVLAQRESQRKQDRFMEEIRQAARQVLAEREQEQT